MSPQNSLRPQPPELAPRHSIAVVAHRTGLTQLVLRAWERRYAAVVPGRTPTGRRRYSDQDLQKLLLLKHLTDNGHRIGDVADLSVAQLEDLYEETLAGAGPKVTQPQGLPSGPDQLLDEALMAVGNLDGRQLEDVLDRGLLDLSKPDLRSRLLVPLLHEIGRRWQDGQLRVAHEHMATSIVTTFLAALNSRYRVSAAAPVLVVATPVGHLHELGGLLAASSAFEQGWDVLYLGPDLPAEDIAAAVRQRGARAVLLSLVYPFHDPNTITELRELRRLLGSDIPLLAGGQAVPSYLSTLNELRAVIIGDLNQLDEALKSL